MNPDTHPTDMDSAQLYWACQNTDTDQRSAAYQWLWAYLYRVVLQIAYDQPDANALAQNSAQSALIRVHGRIQECREPQAFRKWARQIASHLVIDELRRRKKLLPLDPSSDSGEKPAAEMKSPVGQQPETQVLDAIAQADLRRLLEMAPISDRSRRLVIGRYLDDQPDEILSQLESTLSGHDLLPSHIQVTRTKNITKLRHWELLKTYFASV